MKAGRSTALENRRDAETRGNRLQTMVERAC